METNISTQIQQLQTQLISSQNIHNQSQSQSHHNDNDHLIIQNNKLQSMIKLIINSLKLNQKLYNSITQKQSKINQSTNLIINITTQTDHKLQNVINKTKQLYQDTVHQNQKSRYLLEQFISPIRQQLRSKVDETTFTLQMKMILDQYDVIGHQISYDITQQQVTKQQRRKSVNSQTLSFLRDKILPVISNIENRLQLQINNGQLLNNRCEQLFTWRKYIQQQVRIQRQIIEQIQIKNIKRINEKMSDELIDKRMRQSIKYLMSDFNNDIMESIQKLSRYIKNVEYTNNSKIQGIRQLINRQITNKKAQQQYIKLQLDKQQHISKQYNILLKQQSIKINKLIQKSKLYDQFTNKIQILYKQISNINSNIQNKQFSNNNNNKSLIKSQQYQSIIKKLLQFDIQNKKYKSFEKQIQSKTYFIKGQLQGIRDILSKKANFTDILLHIQNKVNKQQFKQLKHQLLSEQYNQFYNKSFTNTNNKNNQLLIIKQSQLNKHNNNHLNNSYNINNINNNKNNNRSLIINRRHIRSRSFFSPSTKQKPIQQQSQTQQIKRFKLGFNHQFLSKYSNKNQFSKTQYIRKSINNNHNPNNISNNHSTNYNYSSNYIYNNSIINQHQKVSSNTPNNQQLLTQN